MNNSEKSPGWAKVELPENPTTSDLKSVEQLTLLLKVYTSAAIKADKGLFMVTKALLDKGIITDNDFPPEEVMEAAALSLNKEALATQHELEEWLKSHGIDLT